MSGQASSSGGGGFCRTCYSSGHLDGDCPNIPCRLCKKPGHTRNKCPRYLCCECSEVGHIKRYCPKVVCDKCGGKGHIRLDCICPICNNPGHNELQCSKDRCSFCKNPGHKAINCPLLICNNCWRPGHHQRNCIGCWHCGANNHFAGKCIHANKVLTSYPPKVFGLDTKEKGHKNSDCPKERGHNKNMFRNLKNDMHINKTPPDRHDVQGSLVIDPSGRGYFVNTHRKEFHWYNQFGSDIYTAEHQSETYMDFDAKDHTNHLYCCTSDGNKKLKLKFQTGNLLRNGTCDIECLEHEVSALFSKDEDKVNVCETSRESFLVDFSDGHIILPGEIYNHVDIIDITRVNITLQHKLWSLKFALFEALMPCRCGILTHDVACDKFHKINRHHCFVETARGYDHLISLTIRRGIKIPLVNLIVDLKSETKRANSSVTRSAMYQSSYVVTAEESHYHDSVIYQTHNTLDWHPNILQFYGTEKFLQRSYYVFGCYESTLFDIMTSGNMADNSNVNGWIHDVVKGLLWLHKKGLHHGSILPQNIVIRDNRAMLHGLTKDGSTDGDIEFLAALMYYCFSGVHPPDKQEQYIPSIEDCRDKLLDSDFEAYDLVEGLRTSRLQLSDVLTHPKFWNTSKRLDFVSVTSDNLHFKGSDLIPLVEEIENDIYVRFSADPSFAGLFYGFIAESQHYGHLDEYKGRKVGALCRCLRNAYSHVMDRGERDEYFGGDIDKLDGCIRALYPRLIAKMFTKLEPLCRTRAGFREFYNDDDESLQ